MDTQQTRYYTVEAATADRLLAELRDALERECEVRRRVYRALFLLVGERRAEAIARGEEVA